jgi:hypothetical protein
MAPLLAQESDPTTIGGYGEIHYTNPTGPHTPAEVNVKRFVLYVGHGFGERITLRTELELEDTKLEGGEDGGEVALEQAFLDYRFSDAFTLRAGLMLAPVGIINETHEPPTFNGVARPLLETEVIPATWRDIGLGGLGRIPGSSSLAWRLYLVSGLNAAGFAGATGVRGGRQEGKEASFANPSLTGRLEWSRPGLKLGGSFWYGGSAAQDSVLGEGAFDNAVSLLSVDARYEVGIFAFRAVGARIAVAGAGRIDARYATDVGSRIEGGYLEGAADLVRALAPAAKQRLAVFVRHERYDLHADVPAGLTRNDRLARRITTLGLTFKPVWNVAFKADYQLRRNRAGIGQDEALSLGAGYQF